LVIQVIAVIWGRPETATCNILARFQIDQDEFTLRTTRHQQRRVSGEFGLPRLSRHRVTEDNRSLIGPVLNAIPRTTRLTLVLPNHILRFSESQIARTVRFRFDNFPATTLHD
jgi:hypothetical protein